jgi:hypothetical protein
VTDVELVERFWQITGPDCKRQSPDGYRSWMLKNARQFYKILLDGLAKQAGEHGE